MKVIKTNIDGLAIIQPDIFYDERGYFFETFNERKYRDAGINAIFVQDNESKSKRNTIRGLHYQVGKYAQGKLVRVIFGKILDVAVDIRFGSHTFGKYYSVELSSENKWQFWIPAGFAHGFSVLSDIAIVAYKCTTFYSRKDERGIIYNDPDLLIDWKVEVPIISEKDLKNTLFKNIDRDFLYQKGEDYNDTSL